MELQSSIKTITSLEIADLTGKRHDNVMRDIRAMVETFEDGANSDLSWHCELTTYSDSQGKDRPVYRLDKDTTLVLLSGYDTVARLKIVKRWQQLEAQALTPVLFNPASVSRREMALMILDAEAEIDRLSKEVKELETVVVSQAKKVAYVDNVLTAKNCWTTTSIAKDDLNMSAIALNQLLKDLGVQFVRDNHWVLKSQYENRGYSHTETFPYESKSTGATLTSRTMKWTELGRAFVIKKVTDYRNRQLAIQAAPINHSANA